MISKAIETAFKKKMVRGWDKWPRMYWVIDLHDVIIPGTYTRNNENRQFYPYAQEVLQWLTNRKDMCIILWTSSHDDAVMDILQWLAQNDVKFDYHNGNPECKNTELCDFKDKFYFDICLEDKAGFEPEDWLVIKETLLKLNEWDKKISHSEK